MIRLPKLTIFAFVACAIALAGFIHHFYSGTARDLKSENSADLSSTAEDLALQMALVGAQAGGKAAAGSAPVQAAGACPNCATALAGVSDPMVQFEDFGTCDKKRQYLEKDLDKLPAIYKNDRSRSPGDFPRVCMTYIMRKNFAGVETVSTNALSVCKDPNGKPTHGNYPACVTEKYVNATYNYFTDITSCLGIPQRDFLPKLYLESGLHVNSINTKAYDGGLAQLTGPAIEYAKEEFSSMKRDVAGSTDESCKRLAPYIKDLKPADSETSHRCQLMTVPANPLLSIVTMAAKIRQDTKAINNFMARPEFDIIARMDRLGLRSSDYDRAQLMQLLIALGYNAGAKSAVIALSNYLKAIEASGRTLTIEDFNVGGESLIYSSVKGDTRELTRKPDQDDERWAIRVAKFKERMDQLPTLNTQYKPKVVPVRLSMTVGKKTTTYDSYRLDFKPHELSFSAYMQIYQTSGAAGYLNFVARRADELNSQFKAGTCVPESYLAL